MVNKDSIVRHINIHFMDMDWPAQNQDTDNTGVRKEKLYNQPE
jgi:hypothetical protein